MSVEGERNIGGISSRLFDESILPASAAQELISPLVLLRQLGLSASENGLDPEQQKLLGEQMTLTSERALRMVTSLSMISSSQQMLPLEPVNPMTVCREVVHELSPMFTAHGQKITLQSRSRVPLTVANRNVLQRILLAFGDNALHYGSDEHPISMAITGYGDIVRIGIRDRGPAVPTDIWNKLEDRVSRRARAPLSNRPHASGVSLMAVRRLAERMNSVVGIVRHRDGATFYIDLNVSRQTSLL